MDRYQWLRDNLFCMASLAEFKGQPEASERLMNLYHELELGRVELASSHTDSEFNIGESGVNVVSFGSTARMLLIEDAK